MKEFFARWQQYQVQKALTIRRVILLGGARQCGKTTLAKEIATKSTIYRTLDNHALRELAINDPEGFVKHPGGMLIIDEIQRAPDLLPAIKLVVDENMEPGQFLLTGSANIQSLPSVKESLAGRIRKIRLRTLTQGEILGSHPVFLEQAFEQSFLLPNQVYNRSTMLDLSFRGGFPEAIKLPENERRAWHIDYITALLERDLNDVAHITRHRDMRELVNILAAWSGKFMDVSAIGAGLSIRRPTLETYMNALEALFIVESVSAWTRTDYERVGKQSKLFMTDTGLMSSMLRWRKDQVELDSDRSGKLIESFVYNELAAQIDVYEDKYALFHYRDREQHEIDFLIERDDQALLGIEVKAGSAISTNDFKHLRWFKDNIAKDRSFIGIVLYSGEHVGSMGENLWAVPFGSMWAN